MDGLAEANSIDGKALRIKRFPQPVRIVNSVRASHSADFSLSESGFSESQIRHKRRPSTASSASRLLSRRRMSDSHWPGKGSKAHHSCAFRVTNDFVARSDGMLKEGSVTRISGFSVAHDTITLSVRASGDTETNARPSSATGTRVQTLTCRAKSMGLSGSWHIDLPQPRFSADAFTIVITSARTGSRAEFKEIRWGNIAAGLGDGLEIHSQLPLRYPGHVLPLGSVEIERARREAIVEKENSLGSLSGMVTNLPELEHPEQGRCSRARSAELDMMKMLRIPCAGNTLEANSRKIAGSKVYGRFPLDAYTTAA